MVQTIVNLDYKFERGGRVDSVPVAPPASGTACGMVESRD